MSLREDRVEPAEVGADDQDEEEDDSRELGELPCGRATEPAELGPTARRNSRSLPRSCRSRPGWSASRPPRTPRGPRAPGAETASSSSSSSSISKSGAVGSSCRVVNSEKPTSCGGAPTSRSTLSSSSWYVRIAGHAPPARRDAASPSPPRARKALRPALGLALLRALSLLGHRERLARLAVSRVPAAPAAVLAHLDPVRVVALRLLGLVVTPLALVACECHGDSNVSAGHGSSVGLKKDRSRRKKDPAGQRRVASSVARPYARA